MGGGAVRFFYFSIFVHEYYLTTCKSTPMRIHGLENSNRLFKKSWFSRVYLIRKNVDIWLQKSNFDEIFDQGFLRWEIDCAHFRGMRKFIRPQIKRFSLGSLFWEYRDTFSGQNRKIPSDSSSPSEKSPNTKFQPIWRTFRKFEFSTQRGSHVFRCINTAKKV